MQKVENGFFAWSGGEPREGLRYAYLLDDSQHELPDPASRWQPDGVHRPSAVFLPQRFSWTDQDWTGLDPDDLVIYELHVGTFTPQGTFAAIIERLPELRELGITALELMPIAQFPGERNWGYDGVHPYAVQNSYGGPRELQRLVNAAHENQLGVILDVVYNHLGPEGNYLGRFGPYFTDRYHTPWGAAFNFDGRDSDPVRKFVIDNACMWVRDFHIDGLRLDAVQTVYDFSAKHILAELQEEVQALAAEQKRWVVVIAESNQNDVRLVTPPELGGYGLDGAWSDDFHHSVHALLTGERDSYYIDFGEVAQLAKAAESVFVYDGCYSPFHRRRHGNRVNDLPRCRFVTCLQNQDQVGNRPHGDRLATLLEPAQRRLAAGLLLTAATTPLLFMGEEYGETSPFPFFVSFLDSRLADAVRRGRRLDAEYLKLRFTGELPDPASPATFDSAKISWELKDSAAGRDLRALYRDLLALRHKWSRFPCRRAPDVHVSESVSSLVIEYEDETRALVCANLSPTAVPLPFDIPAERSALLSTESTKYGGARPDLADLRQLLPWELV